MTTSDSSEHFEWQERLQDWIDGDLDLAHRIAVDEHLANCAACRAHLSALRSLDAALTVGVVTQTLDVTFDRRVVDGLSAASETARVAARLRLEREWRDQQTALSHQWHDVWKSLTLNALAATAVLIALLTAFGLLPAASALIQHTLPVIQYVAFRPSVMLLMAVGVAAAGLWAVHSADSKGP